jgi:hypothetical protein
MSKQNVFLQVYYFPRFIKTRLTLNTATSCYMIELRLTCHVCFLIVLSLLQYQQVFHPYLVLSTICTCYLDVVVQSGTHI